MSTSGLRWSRSASMSVVGLDLMFAQQGMPGTDLSGIRSPPGLSRPIDVRYMFAASLMHKGRNSDK